MIPLFQIKPDAKVVALTEEAETDALVRLLEGIAQELRWQPGRQLQDYRSVAQHLAVLTNGEMAGGLQVIADPVGGQFPFRSVWPDVELGDETRAAHVTILALKEAYRGRCGLFWPLCVELWRLCRRQDVRMLLLEATPPTLRLYRRLGWPLEIVGDLRRHWGEDCYLCGMDVRAVAETLKEKALRAETYRELVTQAYQCHEDPPPAH